MKRLVPGLVVTAIAGTAVADSGVTNPAVMAGMKAMGAIGAERKVLARMAPGQGGDAAQGARRIETVAATGARMPVLFEAPEDDPNAAAAPANWARYPEFSRRASCASSSASSSAANPATGGPGSSIETVLAGL